MNKLYVWEDTDFGGGSAFGGTICAIAATADEARDKIRHAAHYHGLGEPNEHWDRECRWGGDPHTYMTGEEVLNEDLAKEPQVMEVCLAYGGNL